MVKIICTHMKIKYEQTGAYVGIVINTIIDTDNLSEEDKKSVHYLINESNFFKLNSVLLNENVDVDYVKYKISVIDDNKSHIIETTDITMDPRLKPLVRYLQKKAIENRS